MGTKIPYNFEKRGDTKTATASKTCSNNKTG
jgi:hypothetical protein